MTFAVLMNLDFAAGSPAVPPVAASDRDRIIVLHGHASEAMCRRKQGRKILVLRMILLLMGLYA